MTTIRIGVIGTGVMGADHVEPNQSRGPKYARLQILMSVAAEAVGARVPGAKALSSAEALIESAEIDAVIIASSSWVNAILAWPTADLKNVSGPVRGPDAWDGYRAAVIAETLVASMSSGGPVRVESLAIPGLYQQARS